MTDAPLLKDSFGPTVPIRIAEMVAAVAPDFDSTGFCAATLDGYDDLELMARSRKIADELAVYLPSEPDAAIDVLHRSLPSESEAAEWTGIAGFILMPHGIYVSRHGLGCFEESMQLQYEITKLFTSEFSIRAFIAGEYERTMERLARWAHDPNEHVRRLVSEGTRSRLPWAARLPMFQSDPHPVVELLELLKDDPSGYVRRSVANNLNDIAKDNPDVTIGVAKDWYSDDASPERKTLVRHGLRTLIKQGDPRALAVLGYAETSAIKLSDFTATPEEPMIGESVRVAVIATNTTNKNVRLLIDFAIDFVKANGTTSRKVFKGGEFELGPQASESIAKTISVRQHTTRTHYPGVHDVYALVNGSTNSIGSFTLLPA
ncbi:MAG: hypothetical protein WA988_07735 [Candidatus Nanopelagicales bacterium]